MQVSLKWLKDYVDIEVEPEALASILTMAGLEVESVSKRTPSFSGVVAAGILTVKPHPRADNLSLCEVTDGSSTYSVVCGAPNIMPGDVVPLAKTGAVLPSGVTISETKIRGELSAGMLCSEEELGIGSDASGVMILFRPQKAELYQDVTNAPCISWTDLKPIHEPSDGCERVLVLGEDFSKAVDLQDVIFDISVTPNRSDCLSVTGIAREIAALTGKKFRFPRFVLAENEEDISGLTSVSIQDPDLCPRYTARIIKNVFVKPSPLWMRMRLEGAGFRPISNVVDVTNFVMLEMGQPLHAFDYRYLAEGRIVVRISVEGEVFTTLDGKERVLKPDILLICDGEKPVAIGGIMGGLNSEVKEDTETVLLESAYFDPISIRLSTRWLGMTTDAAFRFERGIDPEGVAKAQNRAAQLMAKLSGGVVCRNIIDQYPRKIGTAKNIPVRVKRVCDILGADIKDAEILPILESLEIDVRREDKGEETYLVVPPSFRVDLWREIDIIEEIARIRGYDRIPATLPAVSLAPVRYEVRKVLEDKIRGVLMGEGYSEVITYSFVSPQWADRFAMPAGDERRKLLHIKNPLVEDQSVMRTTLLCGLMETMKKNAHMGCLNLKIFEIGRVFFAREKGELPLEKNRLGCLITGIHDDELWHSTRIADFYDLKGAVEGIFSDFRIGEIKFCSDVQEPFLHPAKSAGIMIGVRQAGFLGEVHREVMERLDLKNAAFVLELDTDILAEELSHQISYREISRFPSIIRDVALLIDKHLEAGKVLGFIQAIGEELLEKVCIFDIYEGKGIPDGLRSLGLRFTYRSSEKTLTDEEITAVHGGIVEGIVGLTGARIRG
jgi:phenylalanyl-tRNA synthetase beta chain